MAMTAGWRCLIVAAFAVCLVRAQVDVNATEPDGSTALLRASYKDDLKSADLLIRAGANVNAANDLGVTPLWAASQNGSAPMVKRLLDGGANPNLALLAGETPVMVAARSGYPDIVEMLLAKKANPNAHGARGQTALMWAVAEKHPEVVKVLLAHGVDIQARSDVWTDVMAVPPHSILAYNKAIPHGGETALMFAARVGDLDFGEAASDCRRQRERRRCLGCQRYGPCGSLRLPGAGGVSTRQRR